MEYGPPQTRAATSPPFYPATSDLCTDPGYLEVEYRRFIDGTTAHLFESYAMDHLLLRSAAAVADNQVL